MRTELFAFPLALLASTQRCLPALATCLFRTWGVRPSIQGDLLAALDAASRAASAEQYLMQYSVYQKYVMFKEEYGAVL